GTELLELEGMRSNDVISVLRSGRADKSANNHTRVARPTLSSSMELQREMPSRSHDSARTLPCRCLLAQSRTAHTRCILDCYPPEGANRRNTSSRLFQPARLALRHSWAHRALRRHRRQ